MVMPVVLIPELANRTSPPSVHARKRSFLQVSKDVRGLKLSTDQI